MARSEWRKHQQFPTMTLAGIAVNLDLVRWLADTTDEPTGSKLDRALTNETRILALEIEDRERSASLGDPPAGLEELRATLLQEHVWRAREGR